MARYKKTRYLFMIFLTALTACKKFVQIPPPPTSITGATTYSNNTSAAAVMTGVYDQIMSNTAGLADGSQSIGFLEGMAADELKNYTTNTPEYAQFYTNSLQSSSAGASNVYFWGLLYNQIYVCNAVITGLNTYTGVTPAMKQQLIGEAEFMRAYLHFYATNLYGAVPIVTTINYQANTSVSRSPQALLAIQHDLEL